MSNNPRYWSDDEIRDYFDSNPNLRMSQLARMTGKSMPELKRILMPGRRQAGPGAGVTVALSGDLRRGRPLQPDFNGSLSDGRNGKIKGKVKVSNVTLESAYDSASIKSNAGHIEQLDVSSNIDEEFEHYADFAEEGLDLYIDDIEVIDAENVTLSAGFTRSKAPRSFDVEVEVEMSIMAGNDHLGTASVMAEGLFVTSSSFQDAWNSLDDPEDDGEDYPERHVFASAKRVASQYKEARGEERGMGGLLFRFDRDGLNIRTMPSDPPYNQTYSNTLTLSSSGKMAKRNLAKVWNDYKREIMAIKIPYKVTDFIDKKLKEMGTRGRIKWHTKHYPD